MNTRSQIERRPADLDVESEILLCPTCATANVLGASRCVECFRRLNEVAPSSPETARTVQHALDVARKRKRLLAIAGVVFVLMLLAGWRLYDFYGFTRFMGDPTTTISSTPASVNDWPMVHRNPSHNGLVRDAVFTPTGEVVWSFDFDTTISGSPAVVDGVVYVGAGRQGFVALDGGTGDTLWHQPMTAEVITSVTVAGDFLYGGLRDGRVVAVNRHTGDIEWELLTGNKVFSTPVVVDGIAYVGSGDFYLYAVDAATGDVRWTYRAGNAIVASPAVTEEVIAFMAQDRKLYILETKSAKLRFDYQVDFTGNSPSIFEDRVYVGDSDGVLRSIDWHQRTWPFEKAFAALRYQGWWFGLASLENQKGFVWGFSTPESSILGTPVSSDNLVYVTSSNGRLYAVDRETGLESWHFRVSGPATAAPTVLGDTVILADHQGRIYGLKAGTGQLLWEIQGLAGTISSPPIFANKTLYVVTEEGVLAAVR
ncbi:MAG: PQQ-binding-like beta-propeller repeat protein [Chloroflexi bacterium]|nr:PQQ-binding-like beta-propeller repeat protein [Chloroflexota bacterium]